jgi:hypothetical protein
MAAESPDDRVAEWNNVAKARDDTTELTPRFPSSLTRKAF